MEGYNITGASSATDALKLIEKVKPDLVLCDIIMPVMNGYELVQHLKSSEDLSHIPVIFLTSKTSTEDIVKGFETGAVDYVTKPFNTAELLARVKTHLLLKFARETIQQQNKKLLALNDEKSHFLSIAAHDIKNPLSSVSMIGELFKMTAQKISPEKIQEYADILIHDSERMLHIITNLLDIDKIESGHIQIQSVPCSLSLLLQDIYQGALLPAQKKDIQLEIIQGVPELEVISDKNLLTQVLENLLSNALKFSPKNSRVVVRLKHEPIRIEIQDQGPGFTPEDQAKMYHKFARLSAKPTANETSTGLGLAIVKELCDLLGIKLELKTSSQGSCFTLIFEPH